MKAVHPSIVQDVDYVSRKRLEETNEMCQGLSKELFDMGEDCLHGGK